MKTFLKIEKLLQINWNLQNECRISKKNRIKLLNKLVNKFLPINQMQQKN